MTTAVATDAGWSTEVTDVPVSLSAGGGLIAVGGAEGGVWAIDAATGRRSAALNLDGGVLRVAVSPGGKHLAATGAHGYGLWRRSDGRTRLAENGSWSAAAAWAGEDVVAVGCGRQTFVLDAAGAPLWRTEPAASTVTDLLWLRDGRRLAVAAYGAVRCHERHAQAAVATYDYVGSHLVLAAASTGKWLCSGNQDASIHIWRIRDAHELTMSGYRDKVARIAFDDTGRWLASDGSSDIMVWDFAGKGPAGSYPRILVSHDGITAIAWRPGSAAHLATGGSEGAVALWEASSGRPGGQLAPTRRIGTDAPVTALAWAGPSLLVVATRDGRVQGHRLLGRSLA